MEIPDVLEVKYWDEIVIELLQAAQSENLTML